MAYLLNVKMTIEIDSFGSKRAMLDKEIEASGNKYSNICRFLGRACACNSHQTRVEGLAAAKVHSAKETNKSLAFGKAQLANFATARLS